MYADTTQDGEKTNTPPRVSIRELLENKDRWESHRVEVLGYYVCGFEHSVLTTGKGEPSHKGLWIDPFRIAPGGRAKIGHVTNATVRVVGTFKVNKGRGSGHAGKCPAEITKIELLEETKEHLLNE
jgi:hypothetical protein